MRKVGSKCGGGGAGETFLQPPPEKSFFWLSEWHTHFKYVKPKQLYILNLNNVNFRLIFSWVKYDKSVIKVFHLFEISVDTSVSKFNF